MTQSLLRWDKLKPYKSSQHQSFEEFCYQLAVELFGDLGTFTSINDSGGGDGVEFYLTLANGDQWGWQAKFYYPDSVLTSSRRESIKDSLQKSCEVHPDLKKWFLCIPRNLTPDDQTWYDDKLVAATKNGRRVVPTDRVVKLRKWGESEFLDFLRRESLVGIRQFFFGELELSLEWFNRVYNKQLEAIKDKFHPDLHTETAIDTDIHYILGDEQLTTLVEQLLTALAVDQEDTDTLLLQLKEAHASAVKEIDIPNDGPGEVGTSQYLLDQQRILLRGEELHTAMLKLVEQLNWARDRLAAKQADKLYGYDWDLHKRPVEEAISKYQQELPAMPRGDPDAARNGKQQENWAGLVRQAMHFLDNAQQIVLHLEMLSQVDLHVLGAAGYGKTHLACYVCNQRLDAGLPAILLLGIQFASDAPLEQQLLSVLGIPPTYSWSDFIKALNSAATAHRTRIPIVIDGLNEALKNGVLSDVWELGLPGLIRELEELDSVVLITTCRSSYESAIWPKGVANTTTATGFGYLELYEAISKYFRAYKLQADLTIAPLEQFRRPIFLKIYCEAKNLLRQDEQAVYIGEQSLYEIFDEYISGCNEAAVKQLRLRRNVAIIKPGLELIAKDMWERKERRIAVSRTIALVDEVQPDKLEWHKSKTHLLESANLIISRDLGGAEEEYLFTYDLLAGYLIADYLITSHKADLGGFLNSTDFEEALYGQNKDLLHPLYEDIRRGMAGLLPMRMHQYLHDLSANEDARKDSIEALFEIAPDLFDIECVRLVANEFDNGAPKDRQWLLEQADQTVGHPSHPLNADFWFDRLERLSIPDRDLSWTEYARSKSYRFESAILYFEKRCRSTQPYTTFDLNRIGLLAKHYVWLLTSTVRALRDKATQALYWFGRRFPQTFFGLLRATLRINDPYIPERMLAAAYGIAMARQHDFTDESFAHHDLPNWGRFLYSSMFAPDAPWSTTHVLARDYASHTIEIALAHHNTLLNTQERELATPPFVGGRPLEWGQRDEPIESMRDQGPMPLQMDFENYTIGSLVENRRNYDYDHLGYRLIRARIYWRIYNLGYSLDMFGGIDAAIGRMNTDRRLQTDEGKVERYGKKYSWIAFYELSGYLTDQVDSVEATVSDEQKSVASLEELAESLVYTDPATNDDQDDEAGDYSEARLPHVDIDPSFPDLPHRYQLLSANWLGPDCSSTTDWIRDGGVPDIELLLNMNDLLGEAGSWLLVDGFVDQEDTTRDRNRFTYIRSFLVRVDEYERVVPLLEKQNLGNRWLPEKPETHYLYAGEIPWCSTFSANEWSRLRFVESSEVVIVPEHGYAFKREGEDMPEADLRALYQELKEGELSGLSEKALLQELTKRRITVAEILSEKEEVRQKVAVAKVLIPVREFSWGADHSVINSNQVVYVLARQISEDLQLVGQPQTFDLFDNTGHRASIVIAYEESSQNRQHYTYLRSVLRPQTWTRKSGLRVGIPVFGLLLEPLLLKLRCRGRVVK